ncbi:putative gpi-anchored cell wall beta-endoglucanase [Phaeomoniella chlamydospora]|uniref:glucan endo-1,3-beta-D-glucosidase n=1 Tax=Phaeomoniella chlamydospora TaxID=158046 RepID=A0A0G2E3F7_PHACM|nr:putative gpi-anchored cell wall beta-endoglucanase [Phaeomoniella chlamydospora]
MLDLMILTVFLLSPVTLAKVYQGFNYGATFNDDSPKTLQNFTEEFTTARSLVGTSSAFTSARLFTMIQAGTPDTPSAAIQAALDTNTTLLLGLWASSGPINFSVELQVLESALKAYGQPFVDLIVGIAVGSEDLYRMSPLDHDSQAGYGASADEIVSYIKQTKSVVENTAASGVPIGHVDTWTAWVNSSNKAVIEASDFLGMDAYPYYQDTEPNSIDLGSLLFFDAYNDTVAMAMGKPVWNTEAGWPVSGPTSNQAVPSLEDAQKFWNSVGCEIFGQINTWWFTLQDAYPNIPAPSFGVVGSQLGDTPLYDLSCGATSASTSSLTSVVSSSTPTISLTQSSTTSATSTTPSSSASSCPNNLLGAFQFPHLIIPIDENRPDQALGDSYYGNFSHTVSTLFNFDIPISTAGLSCTLIFLFPNTDQMPSASYSLEGSGGLYISSLVTPVMISTNWNNAPPVAAVLGTIAELEHGSSYTLGTGECPSGQKIGIEVSGTDTLNLTYFQDSGAPGIGLYITVC